MANTSPPASLPLHGKTALVTGGSRGIGAGISIELARKGVSRLAITYVGNVEGAEATLAAACKLGVDKTIAIQADICDAQIGQTLIPAVLHGLETTTLDIIVNNAALTDMKYLQPVRDFKADLFTTVMQANAFAPMSIATAAIPHLPKRGGRIINISSIGSKLPNEDPMVAYGASKAALDSITRSLAVIFGRDTLATFNSVSVGGTATDGTNAAIKAMPYLWDKAVASSTAEKRLADVEDVACAVSFLASDDSRWINGVNLAVNGGHRELLALQG